MDKLLPGLLIAAISGLTFVAYRHPKGYFRLYNIVFGLTAIAFIGVTAWDAGTLHGGQVALPFIDPSKLSAAVTAVSASRILTTDWIIIVYAGCAAYGVLLLWLPSILGLGKEEPPQK